LYEGLALKYDDTLHTRIGHYKEFIEVCSFDDKCGHHIHLSHAGTNEHDTESKVTLLQSYMYRYISWVFSTYSHDNRMLQEIKEAIDSRFNSEFTECICGADDNDDDGDCDCEKFEQGEWAEKYFDIRLEHGEKYLAIAKRECTFEFRFWPCIATPTLMRIMASISIQAYIYAFNILNKHLETNTELLPFCNAIKQFKGVLT
jgi:hypothetical protein